MALNIGVGVSLYRRRRRGTLAEPGRRRSAAVTTPRTLRRRGEPHPELESRLVLLRYEVFHPRRRCLASAGRGVAAAVGHPTAVVQSQARRDLPHAISTASDVIQRLLQSSSISYW